jgi:hypothetical protein
MSVDGADTALASEVWSRSPDVSFIHPRGHDRGWEEVKRNVHEKLMGATFSERKLTPQGCCCPRHRGCGLGRVLLGLRGQVQGDRAAARDQGPGDSGLPQGRRWLGVSPRPLFRHAGHRETRGLLT